MSFIRRKIENHFDYSTKKKVDFYFHFFLTPFFKSHPQIRRTQKEIKGLLFEELSNYCFNGKYPYPSGKYGIRKLQSELGSLTGDWSIDWMWILHHITLDYKNIELARNLMKSYQGQRFWVYKYLPAEYYDFAEKIYLKNIETKEPKIFDLKTLIENGVGLRSNMKEYKPVVGVTLWKGFDNDFWDMTELKLIGENYHWNSNKRMFEINHYKRTIDRKSKVIITIGDKKYEV